MGERRSAEERLLQAIADWGMIRAGRNSYGDPIPAFAKVRRLLREVERATLAEAAERAVNEIDSEIGDNWQEQYVAMCNRVRAAVGRRGDKR